MLDGIFNHTPIPLLKRILDLSSLRHKAVASNVANASTPGYQQKEVAFDDLLQESFANKSLSGLREDARHMEIGANERTRPVSELTSEQEQGNDNDVNIESEMAELAKNQLLYSAASRLIADNFKALQASIRGRF